MRFIVAVTVLLTGASSWAADIRVLTSGAFTEPHKQLAPEFERGTGHKVLTAYGASMGGASDSIPRRLQRGEPADVVILTGEALEALIKDGRVVPGSRVDLVSSGIGMVVRAGAPKPDIRTAEALKRTLLEAKSIAYSVSASGVYISSELYQRLGIADQVAGKSKWIAGERVAAAVARGDAEIGFQQVSELLPVKGIDYVGLLPPEVQRVTVFSAGIGAAAKEPQAARALIEFYASPAAAPVIVQSGLEPLTRPGR